MIRHPGPRLLVVINPKLFRLEFSPRINIGYYLDMSFDIRTGMTFETNEMGRACGAYGGG